MDKEMAKDVVEVTLKTALSAIPVGGALITAVYDVVKGNALARRQKEWQNLLEERLSKLEEILGIIGNNDLFITALIKTTEMAMKTANEDKRKCLANAVINSVRMNLEEEKMMVFLNLLDKYTISHIKIIHFFFKPTKFDGVSSNSYGMGSPKDPLFSVYPELNNLLFDKIYNDLYVDGMVSTQNLNITMTGNGMVDKRTTELGDEFLEFILEDNL